jgi:hypothetical protein
MSVPPTLPCDVNNVNMFIQPQPEDVHALGYIASFLLSINPQSRHFREMNLQIQAMSSEDCFRIAMHLSNSEAFRSQFTALCNYYFDPSNHQINLVRTMTNIHDIIFQLIIDQPPEEQHILHLS